MGKWAKETKDVMEENDVSTSAPSMSKVMYIGYVTSLSTQNSFDKIYLSFCGMVLLRVMLWRGAT